MSVVGPQRRGQADSRKTGDRPAESASCRICSEEVEATSEQEADHGHRGLAGGGEIFLRLDHPTVLLEPKANPGVVSLPVAGRVGLQADEVDHGPWSSAQDRPAELPSLATWETAYQPTGRTHDRRSKNNFPLGIRVGYCEGAGGVRRSTWCERSAQ